MLSLKGLFTFFFRRTKKETTTSGTSSKLSQLIGAVASDVGCLRPNNEDNFILGTHMNINSESHSAFAVENPSGCWFLSGVFDGMGGGDIGEIAAKTAAEVFLNTLEGLTEASSPAHVDMALRHSFLEANSKIVDLQQQYQVYGTTGTILVTNGTIFKMYHLGDSRAYLLRKGELLQLTRDQTLAQMKIDVGLCQPGDPQAEAEKHKLTEYIGKDQTKTHLRPLESDWLSVQSGDGILLCSDGLYDMCTDHEIANILQACPDPLNTANSLVDAARSHGGTDNVTCIYLTFSDKT